MPSIFAVSDTWFNRLLVDDPNENVVDNNEHIIQAWNEVVKKEDIVYVLGGFGISDLYHILVRLNGHIHFLDNYFNEEERTFIKDMREAIDKSSDQTFRDKVVFETNQIVVLPEQDSILSYFPLEEWSGKSTGTYCFHGLTSEMNLLNHSISCVSKKWKGYPVNIETVKTNINSFDEILDE